MDESESNINKFNEVPYNFLMTCLKKFKKNLTGLKMLFHHCKKFYNEEIRCEILKCVFTKNTSGAKLFRNFLVHFL